MFTQYRRKQIVELRLYVPGEALDRVSISAADRDAGSPKAGDMIARNPKNHDDQWLVPAAYFADNFEPVEPCQDYSPSLMRWVQHDRSTYIRTSDDPRR